jgi:hypothetical protein
MAIRIINCADISAGMSLANTVTNQYGQKLLSAGTILMENHVKLFKTWGIKSIAVETDEQEVPADLTVVLDFETKVLLKKRMNWTPMNEYEMELFNLAVQMISKNKQ